MRCEIYALAVNVSIYDWLPQVRRVPVVFGGLIEWDYGAIFGGILDTWGWGFGVVSLSRSWCLMHAISPNRKHSYLRQKSSNKVINAFLLTELMNLTNMIRLRKVKTLKKSKGLIDDA